MAGNSRAKPPQRTHDNNDDLFSHYSCPSIQNSPDWPSIELRSPGPSILTLNQSDGGTYRDDLSLLDNISNDGLDPSVQSSASTADRSLPSSPSIRADQRTYQSRLASLVLSSPKPTIGSTVFQDNRSQSHHDASFFLDSVNRDLPNPALNLSRPSHSHPKSISQPRPPAPPLRRRASRDSASSHNSDQTVDVPIAWTGARKEDGHSRGWSRSRDPKDNVLPGRRVSAPTGVKVSRPHTLAELVEMAKQSLGDDVRPFKAWLRIAETARRDAKGFQERSDLKSAFIEFARAATIVLEKIPSHADYKVLLSQTQRYNMGLVSGFNQLAPYVSPVPRITMRAVVCIYRPILFMTTLSMFDGGFHGAPANSKSWFCNLGRNRPAQAVSFSVLYFRRFHRDHDSI